MPDPAPPPAAAAPPQKEKEKRVQLISGEKLEALTGLTDRRHRQLAKEGHFPPPVRGLYEMVPALQGLFRYYREIRDREKEQLIDLKRQKLTSELAMSETRLLRERASVIAWSDVDDLILSISLRQKQKMFTIFTVELPAKAEGRGVAEIRELNRGACDEVCDVMRRMADEFKVTKKR